MAKILWRLDGATEASLTDPERLARGLRLHLEHTELTTVLMQRGEQQQSYLAAAGCEGCAHGRCTPGCYVELLRRLLRACGAAAPPSPVAGGLARRPYRRVALAWPTAQTAPLTHLRLCAWPDARLSVYWCGSQRGIACAALLAVGADGPDPAAMLREARWRVWPLPAWLGAKLASRAPSAILPFPRAWPHPPTLLWPEASVRQEQDIAAPLPDAASEAPAAQDLSLPVAHPSATTSAAAERVEPILTRSSI